MHVYLQIIERKLRNRNKVIKEINHQLECSFWTFYSHNLLINNYSHTSLIRTPEG